MKTISLPIRPSLITCDPQHAFPLSVLESSDIDYKPWLFSNYIDMYGNPLTGEIGFCSPAPDAGLLHTQTVDRRTMLERPANISTLLKQSLEGGYYVWASVSQYYLQYRAVYTGSRVMKDILVYGYDSSQDLFSYCAISKNGVFEQRQLPAIHMEQAFWSASPPDPKRHPVRLLRASDREGADFRTGQVQTLLREYLNGGVQLPHILIEQLEAVERREREVKLVYFTLWLEHKMIMQQRLAYMRKTGALTDDSCEQAYDPIYRHAEIIRKSAIRYMWTRETKYKERACRLLDGMMEEERKCLSDILCRLA
ncbi:hypothetical protein DNH61_06410 [Paenibacillus sambharensis]|uniref:Butirosin biosynthesis protein H N-terminal domain-containing protein n=1 Tax=Paenibacillus sambharensis TaxID=1803190 RepID=A0A2W1LCD9_9BACL|nr:hypothetical protein [Paenibacillus sambharensis]PZD96826.1 hypothetical protein DNH61_06410 [Paenibacillus sambharensis]